MGINMQWLRAIHHAKRRDQPYQSKTMITVQVRDKHRVQASRLDPQLTHGNLHALATVHQEGLITQLHHLPRRRVLERRHGTTRAKYGELVVHCSEVIDEETYIHE